MRLDEDKLEALQLWGQKLRTARREESAAAGRAILMLIEEIERLQTELSDAHEPVNPSAATPENEASVAADESEEPASTLHQRLQRALGQDSEAAATPRPEAQTTASAQSWIDSLRRGK
jgi:hypothetical protein